MTSLVMLRPMSPKVRACTLLVGFGGAIALRVLSGGVAVRDSAIAGLLFGAALAALSWAVGLQIRVDGRCVITGLGAAAALCAPVALRFDVGAHRPAGSFASWAVAVAVIAGAEEAFLRGALFDAVAEAAAPWAAVLVGALCFAALHVPLYGWTSTPLDFAVGLLLGGLRWATGNWVAPAVAHVGADLAAWWLR